MAGAVVDFSKMQVGAKGGGKHWTKAEVERRTAAAEKLTRKKKMNLKMPAWLDEESQKVWKKTVKDMKEFEIFDRIDEDVLATYCDAVARHKEATLLVREVGLTEVNSAGNNVQSAASKAQQSYARLMMQLADKLGITANARARLARKMAEEGADQNADLFD